MGSTKGVAVSQIILLVLGILVLAVVAFLLYNNFVNSKDTISAEQCRAQATRACTACVIAKSPTCKDPGLSKCTNTIGILSDGTVDCNYFTGSGTGSTESQNQGAQQVANSASCDATKCNEQGGTMMLFGENSGKCKITQNGQDTFTCPK